MNSELIKMTDIRADLHFHGPWPRFKPYSKETPRDMILYTDYVFQTPLNVAAFTDFMSGEGSFWRQFLVPTIRKNNTYEFEFLDQNQFNLAVYRKSDAKRKDITVTQEVLAYEEGREGHLLAIGSHEHITARRPYEDTAKQIIDTGGLVIPDHPLVPMGGIGKETIRKLAEKYHSGQRLVSGLEWNCDLPIPLYFFNFPAQKLASDLELPVVCNSDGHLFKNLGKAYTTYESDYEGMLGIMDAIRNNQILGLEKRIGSLWGFLVHFVKGVVLNPDTRKDLKTQ